MIIKNQKGVSMVSLVITIIVIIILAAVAFTGSQETIGRAGFSGFVTDIDSVRTAFITEGIPNLMGQEQAKNNTVSEAQAYNYLAKGATELEGDKAKYAWLTKGQAMEIQCTRIEPKTSKAAIGIELPERTVNTYLGTKVKMSYFVTNKGDIFVWPPFLRSDDGLYYVNDVTTLDAGLTEEQIYTGTVTIKFDSGATVVVDSSASKLDLPSVLERIENNEIGSVPGVYYKDERSSEPADGIESADILQNTSPNMSTEIGWDREDDSIGSDGRTDNDDTTTPDDTTGNESTEDDEETPSKSEVVTSYSQIDIDNSEGKLVAIGYTNPLYVVAAFNDNFTSVTITKNGNASDGLMNNFNNNSPMYDRNSTLTSATIENGVTSIGDCVFENCTNLVSIEIPDSVTSIGWAVFIYCSNLASATIPNSVTSIDDGLFYGCNSLKRVDIPNSITNIGTYMFLDCYDLTTINYTGTTAEWQDMTFGIEWDTGPVNYTIYCTDGNIVVNRMPDE